MQVALILAAGRGERLKPLTNRIPKPLCVVQDKPLIEHHIEKLARAGFQRIVINHAHLGDKIRRHLGHGSKWNIEICYSPEPPGALETGGGLVNALSLLGNEPFLTVNSDIFTDYNFAKLSLDPSVKAHLVLVPNPYHNQTGDFGLKQKTVTLQKKHYTFAGIACYHPDAFDQKQVGRYSIVPFLHRLSKQKEVTGEIYGGLWVDVGSYERLQLANSLTIRD